MTVTDASMSLRKPASDSRTRCRLRGQRCLGYDARSLRRQYRDRASLFPTDCESSTVFGSDGSGGTLIRARLNPDSLRWVTRIAGPRSSLVVGYAAPSVPRASRVVPSKAHRPKPAVAAFALRPSCATLRRRSETTHDCESALRESHAAHCSLHAGHVFFRRTRGERPDDTHAADPAADATDAGDRQPRNAADSCNTDP